MTVLCCNVLATLQAVNIRLKHCKDDVLLQDNLEISSSLGI